MVQMHLLNRYGIFTYTDRENEYMKEQNAAEYLLQIPLWAKKKNSFEDIRLFLEKLGNPENGYSMIHVAGTNGKGSVCAFLTSILKESGYRVGTFTSPHLITIRERFMIDGSMVDEKLFEKSFEVIRNLTDEMCESGYCHPTFFEFLFLMGLVIFREEKVDYLVLETGIGGRLDTTNVIDSPAVTVITSISMDHMEYLGDTLEKIAGEKAGIIKEGIPVIYDDNCKEASSVISARAEHLHAPEYPVKRSDYAVKRDGSSGLAVTWSDLDGKQMECHVPFIAQYQAMNAVLACKTANMLGAQQISPQLIAQGIAKTRWPGRMEEVLPGVYLDGAHNDGGIYALVETARQIQQHSGKRIFLLFASVSDKDYKKMIRVICNGLELAGVAAAHIDSPRGLEVHLLEDTFRDHTDCLVLGFQKVEDAWNRVLSWKKEQDLVFCAGSLYLVGEIKAVLRRTSHD